MRVCQFIARFFRHVTGGKNVPPQVAGHIYAGTPEKMGPRQGQMIRGPG